MKLTEALKNRLYFSLAVVFAILMGTFYPYIQSLGNIDIWFQNVSPLNFILYIVFSVLFGVLVSFHIYRIREHKVRNAKSLCSGVSGSLIGFLFGYCTGCVSLISLILPFSAVAFLAAYSLLFTLIGVLLLLFSLYLLHGFEK